MVQEIRDSSQRLVGKIITEGSTKITAQDANGRILGHYYIDQDTTYDANTRKIGNSNLLMSLIKF